MGKEVKKQDKHSKRLPLNFHRTFKPERNHLAAMLSYAASGKSGTLAEISQSAGIPSGASSGKTRPSMDYCAGMGLLRIHLANGVYSFELTPFGQAALKEDTYFTQSYTQWLAHLFLCHPARGAEAWFRIYVDGFEHLGMNFTSDQAKAWLAGSCGRNNAVPGPALSCYCDDASLGMAGVLVKNSRHGFTRRPAPMNREFQRGYAAWLAQLLLDFFPGQRGLPAPEFERACGWQKAAGFNPDQAEEMLMAAEQLGALRIDRHMRPWLIDLNRNPEDIWPRIYADVL